jgi:hypothetical protein
MTFLIQTIRDVQTTDQHIASGREQKKRSNTHLLMGQTLYRTEMHDKSRKPEQKEGYWSETTISSDHSNCGRQAHD